ncbi:MAG: lamin tail domain-containing protein [Bacteroidales bacterium]|jgi:hypothetical protein|nr:lamin tail domain-containing protein [Bacteroidales bacterium]
MNVFINSFHIKSTHTTSSLIQRISIIVLFFMYLSASARAQEPGIIFSEYSGVKNAPFSLTLSTANSDRDIYYTTNGTQPNQQSTQYTQPIQISQTTMVSAVSYLNGTPDEYVSRVGFIFPSQDIQNFTSDVPILLVENFGQGAIPAPTGDVFSGGGDLVPKQFVVAALYEPENGRTSLQSTPTISTNGGIKVRGSSSASFDKKSYGFDSWNTFSEETAIKPLGMAKDADWVLFGSQEQDPTYIRSVWLYELSRQIGQYAPATRTIELFLNSNGGSISQDNFLGIYFFMGKIGRGDDQIDIEKLEDTIQITDPEISGGYILKVDRLDAEATGFECIHNSVTEFFGTEMRTSVTNYYYPKERNIPDHQKPWIRDYVYEFENALQQIPNNRNYTNYFDIDASVTHWILKAMPKDADAFALSEFMNKDRDGTIHMGPIWDLDRSSGSVDDRTTAYDNWCDGLLADYFNYGWYSYLHQDSEYMQALKDKWFVLRQEELSEENTDRIIDSLASDMSEAMTRDVQLWQITRFDGTFQGEINHLKTWIKNRCNWIDSQWERPPDFYNNNILLEGNTFSINAGFSLSMQNNTNLQGTIYYTTDGSDPRMEGGNVNPAATTYTSPLSLSGVTKIKARIYNNNTWSSIRQGTFYIQQDLSKLKITEIHYHPDDFNGIDGNLFEFIELKNTGNTTLYLGDIHFSDGIEFTFPISETIPPGEFVVLASDPTSFELFYGFSPDFIFDKNLSNGGEKVTLSTPSGTTITEVEYDDEAPWPITADGDGFSLVSVSVNPIGNQNDYSKWRASGLYGGSPGEDDNIVESDPVVISEVISNAQAPNTNAIELYNPNDNSVDIGGWLLCNNASLDNAWTIPANTTIPAHGYITFHEGHYEGSAIQYSNQEFGQDFTLNYAGDDVFIFAAQNSTATGYSHGYTFEPALINMSYGAYENSLNETHIVALESFSEDAENTPPLIGPVVISEIMYNPGTDPNYPQGTEFMTITNISDNTVNLYNENYPNQTWKINGLRFTFPENCSIAPSEVIYLKNNDISESEFRGRYELNATTQLFVYDGALDNSGETITIQYPLKPIQENGITTIPYATVDRVQFDSETPWPHANGNGMKLQRISLEKYGNDPVNWEAVDGRGTLPDTYYLTVENGTGSEQIYEFSTVAIEASNPPQGKVFYRWTGANEELFANMYAKSTMFSMPSNDVTLIPEYIDMVEEQIISSGDIWKYHNLGQNLGEDWRTNSYNDNTWSSGSTMLGTDDFVTTTIDIGPQNNRYPTLYFRKTINIANAATINEATLQLRYDDGAVVYINGVEALTINVPENHTYDSWATNNHEGQNWEQFQLNTSLFADGENIIAVEVHNQNVASSDLVFDLELGITKGLVPDPTEKQYIMLNQGWNLISIGVKPDETNISVLFPNATLIKNGEGFYKSDNPQELNSLSTVSVGDVFLINNSQTEQIEIIGTKHTASYQYLLKPGWNFIGVPRTANYTITGAENPAYEVMKNFNNFYDFTSQQGELTSIKSGSGYFIYVNGVCDFYFSVE